MVHNFQKDNLKARVFIDNQINNIITSKIKISLNELIKQTLINHPVSEQMVRGFIKKFYIDEGIIKEVDGQLRKV